MSLLNDKKNIIWNTLGITLNAFLSLFFFVITKRVNGIKIAGIFNYAFAIACLLWVFSMFYNRVYQVSNSNVSNINFIKIRFLFCNIMFFIAFFVALPTIHNTIKFLMIILLCLYRNIEAFADSFYGVFHKNNRLDYVGKSLCLKSLFGVIIFYLIDVISHNVIFAIISLIVINILGLFVDYCFCKKYLIDSTDCTYKKSLFTIFNDSFSILVFSALSILLLNCQKYVIGVVSNEDVQTVFGILIMPATFMSLCGQYLINPFTNRLNILYMNHRFKEMKILVFKLLFILLFFGVFVSIISYIIGIDILNAIYSIELNKFNFMLALIIISSTFYSLTTVLSAVLTIMQNNKIQSIIYVITSILSILLSIFLIYRYDINGAIISYCTIMFIHFILYLFVYLMKMKKVMINENKFNNSML